MEGLVVMADNFSLQFRIGELIFLVNFVILLLTIHTFDWKFG